MNVEGRIDPDKIDTIIFDVDQTLYPYWDGVAEAFSFYTAISAYRAIKPRKNMDYLTAKAKKSYDDHGLTTRWFANQYQLDEITLYRDHYDRMMRDLIAPQWKDKVPENPGLIPLFNDLVLAGKRIFAVSHGTTSYVESILDFLGIRDKFEGIAGIDDYNLRLKSKDVSLFQDFMVNMAISPRVPHCWDNVLFVEDSPLNLAIPKDVFNMQTILKQTGRVPLHGDNARCIDGVIQDIGHLQSFLLP